MTTVFIAGSISINRLHKDVQERINKIVSSDLNVVVGDADGADTAIQHCLHENKARKVTVYCTGDVPRNNVANWPVHHVHSTARAGTRAYFVAKDLEMARSSDYGLMVWDCKSVGTLGNIMELLGRGKKSVVFINKNKEFFTISDSADFGKLLDLMSPHARAKAEEKIDLKKRFYGLIQEPLLFDSILEGDASAQSENFVNIFIDYDKNSSVGTESLRLRSMLESAIANYIEQTHLSNLEAAEIFGVELELISDISRGRFDIFNLDDLVNMASVAGFRVELTVGHRS